MDITEALRVGAWPDSKLTITEYGEVVLSGDATAFDDLRIPLTQTKQGATAKPDFDYTNIGYLFPQNDPDEILYIIAQMPHSWKQGSTIYPHIHYSQDESGQPVFKIDYKWVNTGGTLPAEFTTLALNTNVFTYSSGTIHQICGSGGTGIAGTGKTLSSLLLIKLYRDDNVVSGDVLAYDFDIHFQIDGYGSKTEYGK